MKRIHGWHSMQRAIIVIAASRTESGTSSVFSGKGNASQCSVGLLALVTEGLAALIK